MTDSPKIVLAVIMLRIYILRIENLKLKKQLIRFAVITVKFKHRILAIKEMRWKHGVTENYAKNKMLSRITQF